MPLRDIVSIDEERCDGCGDCITACAEGAIALVNGKARLVSEIYCDGLGACLGHCPQGAITVERREAAGFDENAVAEHLGRQRPSVPRPLLGLPVAHTVPEGAGCPGSRVSTFSERPSLSSVGWNGEARPSALRHWPVQLHLVPPTAPFFTGADVLLAADCVAYAVGGFHERFLSGRALAIACPKLDGQQEIYVEKLRIMAEQGGVKSFEVMVMEVPCCTGLVRLVQTALNASTRRVPATVTVVGTGGDIVGRRPLL
jgi:NAD-dependent dihydropyrimidine dehydrogenase PreA subunit